MTAARPSPAGRAVVALFVLTLATALAPGTQAAPARKAGAVPRKPAARPLAAAAGPARPAPPERDAWQEARALADAGRHDAALALLDSTLRARPDDTGLLWLRAGVTGEAGRHADAIAQFERLLAAHPELGRDLRRDLAAERLDAGDAAGAVRECDALLTEDPSDRATRELRALALSHAGRLRESLAAYDQLLLAAPAETDLQRERARVLAWMGRHNEAVAVHRGILAASPDDRAARLGLAQNENWAGRHRRAARLLEPLTDGEDADAEAVKTLAFARYWSGDAAAARLAADRALELAPEDPEALDLSRRLRREHGAWVQLAYQRADDSDHLRTGTTSMDLHVPLAARTMGAVGWRRDNVRDPGGTRDPLTLWAGLEHVWSAAWAGHATVQHVDLGDSAGSAGMGELGLTWRPGDGLRLDGAWSREPVLTRLALRDGISVQTWAGAAEWTGVPRLALRVAGGRHFYSDDNRAERLAASALYVAWSHRRGRVRAGLAADQLNTRLELDHGYYDPDYHVEWGPQLEAEWWPTDRFTVSGASRTGWQRDKDGEAQPYFNAEGTAEWIVTDVWTLAVGGSRSNSNLQTASGYERRSWRVALTRGF